MRSSGVGSLQSGHGECGESFIKPAHHDSRCILPYRPTAMMAQRVAQIPCQERKAEDPKYGEEGIGVEV